MAIREKLTPLQRATDLGHTIDPGFVHHRKIQTIIGQKGMDFIDDAINKLPDLPDWQKRVRIDHIYTRFFLIFCNKLGIRPLRDLLATEDGHIFCSTENVKPCSDFFKKERVISVWDAPFDYPKRVEFHYSRKKVAASTLRTRLSEGTTISIIAQIIQSRTRKDNIRTSCNGLSMVA